MPAKQWQRIELPEDPEAGIQIIERELRYWDEWLIDKVKFRYNRILETLENVRRLRQAPKVKVFPIRGKVERRNKSREERALSGAQVQDRVKEELLTRLKDGVYGIYNLEEEEFNEALNQYEQEVEFVDESDCDEDEDAEEEDQAKLARA
jgi:protein MAK16